MIADDNTRAPGPWIYLQPTCPFCPKERRPRGRGYEPCDCEGWNKWQAGISEQNDQREQDMRRQYLKMRGKEHQGPDIHTDAAIRDHDGLDAIYKPGFILDDGNREPFESLQEFADLYPGLGQLVVITGIPGVGKTTAAKMLGRTLHDNGKSVLFFSGDRLLYDIVPAMRHDTQGKREAELRYMAWNEADVIILDDPCQASFTKKYQTLIWERLNGGCYNSTNKGLIIPMKQSTDEFAEKFDDTTLEIGRRIADMSPGGKEIVFGGATIFKGKRVEI